MIKKIVQRLGLILFGACLALVATECAMRLAGALRVITTDRAPGPLIPPSQGGLLTILCLGESTTAATWPRDHSWPLQLQQILDHDAPGSFQVVNKGAAGITSDVIESNLPSYLEQWKPQMVIAMVGINDNQWYGIAQSDRRTLENRFGFLRRLKVYRLWRYVHHEFFLHTPPVTPDQNSLYYRDKIVEIIRERRIPLVLMQYPGLNVDVLKEHFLGLDGISYVGNLSSFEKALAHGKYEDYFVDRFAGHFGHCTAAGDRLIAVNAAQAVSRVSNGIQEYPDWRGQTEQFNRAAPTYRATEKSEQDEMPFLQKMIELKSGDPKGALAYAERAVKTAERRSIWVQHSAYLQSARMRLAAGDRAGAKKEVLRALQSEPGNLESLRMMVELTRDSPTEAAYYANLAEHAAQNTPGWDRGRSYLDSARIRLLIDDRKGARELIEKALKIDPSDLDALRMMSDLLHDQADALPPAVGPARRGLLGGIDAPRLTAALKGERPREALRYFRSPPAGLDRIPWLTLRGLVRMFAHDGAGAHADLSAAASAEPSIACGDWSFPLDRSRFETYYFDICLGHFPRSASLFADRGVALYRAGKKQDAASDFRKAIALKPDYTEAYVSLSTLLEELGNKTEALSAANKGLESCRGNEAKPACRDLLSLRNEITPR